MTNKIAEVLDILTSIEYDEADSVDKKIYEDKMKSLIRSYIRDKKEEKKYDPIRIKTIYEDHILEPDKKKRKSITNRLKKHRRTSFYQSLYGLE